MKLWVGQASKSSQGPCGKLKFLGTGDCKRSDHFSPPGWVELVKQANHWMGMENIVLIKIDTGLLLLNNFNNYNIGINRLKSHKSSCHMFVYLRR